MKSNSVIETTINGNQQLVLKFANGEALGVHVGELSEDIQRAAMLHGLKQKLCDAAAISRDPETGKPATVDEKYAAVKEVLDRLLVGEWNAKREGGGQSGGLLYRALCKAYEGKKSPEELKIWLDNKSDAEKAALRANKKIAKIMDSLRPADKKAAAIDSDALLSDLS